MVLSTNCLNMRSKMALSVAVSTLLVGSSSSSSDGSLAAIRPRASGDDSSRPIACEPADSPNTVMRPGSPPNAAMLSRTQRSASSWSRRPLLPLPR